MNCLSGYKLVSETEDCLIWESEDGSHEFWIKKTMLRQKGDKTMNLKPLAANMTELEIDGKRVLFSYQTPVAYKILGLSVVYVTDRFYSQTTNRHINKWLKSFQYDAPVTKVRQEDIDKLVEVKP